MEPRSAVRKFIFVLAISLFSFSILCYCVVGIYFFVDGLRLQSGGGILLGLACWGGVALFSLPLWIVSSLRSQTKRIEQHNARLQRMFETLQGEETIREISTNKGRHDD
jgi:RsiW-degrading membrane proteinase PrsW (M82 family)